MHACACDDLLSLLVSVYCPLLLLNGFVIVLCKSFDNCYLPINSKMFVVDVYSVQPTFVLWGKCCSSGFILRKLWNVLPVKVKLNEKTTLLLFSYLLHTLYSLSLIKLNTLPLPNSYFDSFSLNFFKFFFFNVFVFFLIWWPDSLFFFFFFFSALSL